MSNTVWVQIYGEETGGSGGGAVDQIIAGTGISISPGGGTGNVTITNTETQGITQLTGGVTASGSGSVVATVVTNANLTGDVTSVGNATTLAYIPVISGANLTSLTAANISSGTAGISITGNAATATNASEIDGITVTGTPTSGQVLTATSSTAS